MFTSEAIAAGNDAMQLQVQCLVPIDGVICYLYHGDTTQLAEKVAFKRQSQSCMHLFHLVYLGAADVLTIKSKSSYLCTPKSANHNAQLQYVDIGTNVV